MVSDYYDPNTLWLIFFQKENPEGLDRKQVLNYWGRMRFISNLLPQLKNASAITPHFARSVSLLGTGHANGTIDVKDLELKSSYSGPKNAAHTIIMNDFMAEQYAAREPAITFVHTEPLIVQTGVARELPFWARALAKGLMSIIFPFVVSPHETGQRQLFHATSSMYAPAEPANAALASGVPLHAGIAAAIGSNGRVGSGGYLVSWKGERAQKAKVAGLDEREVSDTIWEATAEVFQRVEKINENRTTEATS